MKPRFYIFGLLITIFSIVSCVPTRHLAEDEQLLLSIDPKGLDNIERVSIEALYQQRPNRTFLGSTPLLSLYYFGVKFYDPQKIQERIDTQENRFERKIAEAGTDTAKVRRLQARMESRVDRLQDRKENGNFLMQVGEPPAIYDSTRMAQTMNQVDIYLNSKGYFEHNSDFQKREKGKKVHVTLQINENEPYRYTKIDYGIQDTAVLRLVQSRENRSLIKLGDIYDEDILTLERDRLNELLRNRGYFEFSRAYIYFDVDSSSTTHSIALKTVIQNPENRNSHPVYTIANVYFKTDADRFGIPRDTIVHEGINYIAYRHAFSPRMLDQKLDVYPGDRYSQRRTATTQRRLSELDVFQFNNIVYSRLADTADSSTYKLNAFVNATPSSRFQETAEIGLNYTERRPGPFASARLRVRNIFGGAENLDIGARFGFEGQVNISDPQQTVMIREYGGDLALSFPSFLFPFVGRKLFVNNNPRTRLYTGYTNVNRSEYERLNYELSLDYILQRSQSPLQPPALQYVFSPVNINIVNVNRIDSTFYRDLDSLSYGNKSLLESFRSGFISYLSFNLIYNTNDFIQSRDAKYFRGLVEVGGLSQQLGVDLDFLGLRTFRYAKFNADYRRYIPLGEKRFFVYRFNSGIALPIFGGDIIPYDKYFFAGGGTSVRAWQPRRLGPGSVSSSILSEDNRENTFLPEQPGEIIVEGSAEYRFNMVGLLNGAFFVDFGNVWWIKENSSRPGGDFKFDRFYKELAVGTGFGLRFDFSVLILRFDFATKVYDPAAASGSKFVLDNFRFGDFFTRGNQGSLNIGIGYPF
ncbi:BamA/TamA family outer membrane protein [Pontibacter sp. SGAir0037]|uniref:translocation and assembly module lipoprotein TamL n=1 Tax=Pontibacter sp. SGAir0037 TaxID=2571030 RepID=UPI0010CD2C61|nr:BamA/TamA family outer membrane protein [Pontibacter sp. SGAir0037]QCR21941.1 hypothetical protein C1N53_06065 [Pontibacter sp. SGAir0037]